MKNKIMMSSINEAKKFSINCVKAEFNSMLKTSYVSWYADSVPGTKGQVIYKLVDTTQQINTIIVKSHVVISWI